MDASELPPTTIIRFTGRQKLAIKLFRAGLSRESIAVKLGIKHLRSVSRLLGQARANERAVRRAAANLRVR